ncbi:uncharacterized protein sS8_2671 [Methylocaldum marinum]|uniref:SAP domain-containing protein n=1 Tax=Methylocaldum marinum TaxID=1432792 RepID=A0A250KSK0_9GAMM|nr:Rho termination factor N-terminal domain-containing protein [Methylocaldum marinum]BBA34618.1 uncharacterized protein sS8_2671 [Methylocaldum marinum]
MRVDEVREIAKRMGLVPGRMSKRDLIRKIQIVEGNFDCFGTARDATCDQQGCLWRKECFTQARKES